jgi:hypothetical protein
LLGETAGADSGTSEAGDTATGDTEGRLVATGARVAFPDGFELGLNVVLGPTTGGCAGERMGSETGRSVGTIPFGAGVVSNIGLAFVGVRAGPGVGIKTGALASAGARVGLSLGLPTGKSTSAVGPALAARTGVDTGNSVGALVASAIGAATGGLGTGAVIGTRVACCGSLEGRALVDVLGGGRRDRGPKVPLDTVGTGELEGSISLGVTLSEGASATVGARTGTAATGLAIGGNNAFEGGSVSDAFDASGGGVKKSTETGPAVIGVSGSKGSGASTCILGATAGAVEARTGAPAASIGAEVVWSGTAMGGPGVVPSVVGGTAMGATGSAMAAGLTVGMFWDAFGCRDALAASGAVAKDGDPGSALVVETGLIEGTTLPMLPGSYPPVGDTSVGPMIAGARDEGAPSMPGMSCCFSSVGGS